MHDIMVGTGEVMSKMLVDSTFVSWSMNTLGNVMDSGRSGMDEVHDNGGWDEDQEGLGDTFGRLRQTRWSRDLIEKTVTIICVLKRPSILHGCIHVCLFIIWVVWIQRRKKTCKWKMGGSLNTSKFWDWIFEVRYVRLAYITIGI